MTVSSVDYLKRLSKSDFYPELLANVKEMRACLSEHSAYAVNIHFACTQYGKREAYAVHVRYYESLSRLLRHLKYNGIAKKSKRKLVKLYKTVIDKYAMYMSNWVEIAHALDQLRQDISRTSPHPIIQGFPVKPVVNHLQAQYLVPHRPSPPPPYQPHTKHRRNISEPQQRPNSMRSIGHFASNMMRHSTLLDYQNPSRVYDAEPSESMPYQIDGRPNSPTPSLVRSSSSSTYSSIKSECGIEPASPTLFGQQEAGVPPPVPPKDEWYLKSKSLLSRSPSTPPLNIPPSRASPPLRVAQSVKMHSPTKRLVQMKDVGSVQQNKAHNRPSLPIPPKSPQRYQLGNELGSTFSSKVQSFHFGEEVQRSLDEVQRIYTNNGGTGMLIQAVQSETAPLVTARIRNRYSVI